MPSGKKSKQARRTVAPPPVQSKGGPRRRQASPRVLAIAGGVALIAIVGIVLGIVFAGGGNSTSLKDIPSTGSIANGLPGASDVQSQYGGIPQKALTLGSAKAPVTLVEYIDLQCPFCQQFETQVMPNILRQYVRTNKVRIEVRPIAFIGPDSQRGRKAMLAAAEQNKAFNFAGILYYNQGTENTGWLGDTMIAQAAASIPGLKVHQLLDARSAGSIASQTKALDAQATADKVSGTPTLFVGKTGTKGKLVALANSTDQQAVVDAISAALP